MWFRRRGRVVSQISEFGTIIIYLCFNFTSLILGLNVIIRESLLYLILLAYALLTEIPGYLQGLKV